MRNWKLGLLATPLAAMLMACPTTPSGPTITSSTPTEGTAGVDPSTTITINFSAALGGTPSFTASPTFTASAPTISGSTLTIKPSSPLAGNTKYTISLNGIQDTSGNTSSGLTLSFTTKNQTTVEIKGTLGVDGTVTGDNNVFKTGDTNNGGGSEGGKLALVRVGTDSAGVALRGYLSFKMDSPGGLPASLTADKIVSATLRINQAQVPATDPSSPSSPYGAGGLGNLTVDDITYGPTLEAGDFTCNSSNTTGCTTAPTLIGTLSTDGTVGIKTLDVLTAVKNDWTNKNNNGARSQFRLKFSSESVANKSVRLSAGNTSSNPATLVISYNP